MDNDANKPKKKHGCLISLLVFFILIILVIGGGYLYFSSQKPDAVTYTTEDVEAFHNKTGLVSGDYAFDFMAFMQGSVTATGRQAVDASFTSAEITGGFQNVARQISAEEGPLMFASMIPMLTSESTMDSYSGSGIFQEVNVRFTGDDEIEVFGTITPRIKEVYAYAPELETYAFAINSVVDATLYGKLSVSHSQASGIQINVITLSINGIPVPAAVTAPYQDDFANQINRAIDRIDAFEIEVLDISKDALYFKGSIPATLKNLTE